MDSSGSGQRQVMGSCGCGNEHSGTIKCRKFFDQLRTCQLLRKDCSIELVVKVSVSQHNLNVHYRVHKILLLHSILSHTDPFHILLHFSRTLPIAEVTILTAMSNAI
jgi:hypothetical protein